MSMGEYANYHNCETCDMKICKYKGLKNTFVSFCPWIDKHELQEHRCQCGRLLGKFNGQAEIKCPKCGKMNAIGVEKLANSGVTR